MWAFLVDAVKSEVDKDETSPGLENNNPCKMYLFGFSAEPLDSRSFHDVRS